MSTDRTSLVTCGVADRRGSECGRLSAGLSEAMWAGSTEALSLRNRGRAFRVGGLAGAGLLL